MSTPFAVTLRAEGGTAVVFVSGEVDLRVSEKFAEVGRLALASQGSAVVFDLADLAFMDSTGLNAMIRIHQAVREAGKSVSLRNVSERTQRLLKLCGLEYLLGPD